MQMPHLGRQSRLALRRLLVQRLPIMGLAAQFQELPLQVANGLTSEPKKQSELAEAIPQHRQPVPQISILILVRFRFNDGSQRSLLREKRNQRVGGITVHASKS